MLTISGNRGRWGLGCEARNFVTKINTAGGGHQRRRAVLRAPGGGADLTLPRPSRRLPGGTFKKEEDCNVHLAAQVGTVAERYADLAQILHSLAERYFTLLRSGNRLPRGTLILPRPSARLPRPTLDLPRPSARLQTRFGFAETLCTHAETIFWICRDPSVANCPPGAWLQNQLASFYRRRQIFIAGKSPISDCLDASVWWTLIFQNVTNFYLLLSFFIFFYLFLSFFFIFFFRFFYLFLSF